MKISKKHIIAEYNGVKKKSLKNRAAIIKKDATPEELENIANKIRRFINEHTVAFV